MKALLPILILLVANPGVDGALSQERRNIEDTPLSEQLEGLGPEPRIAYLRYLLRTGEQVPEVYFQLGVAFHESSRLDSAVFYYERAAEINSEFSKAYVNIGVILDGQGRINQALDMYERALRMNPDDLLAHAHAAFILFQLKDYEKAREYLSTALRIDPDDPQPHYYLAIFFWESRMYREALVEWEKVIDLDPGGYLSERAKENIILLQEALSDPSGAGGLKPEM